MQAKKNQKTCKDENVRERVSVLEIPGELQEFLFAFLIHMYFQIHLIQSDFFNDFATCVLYNHIFLSSLRRRFYEHT